MNKVLVIAPYAYLPYSSGGQKYIAKFLEYLSKKVELTVISTKENDASLAETYKLIPLLKNSFTRYFDFLLISKISSLVKNEKIDTIIWEHPYFAWLAQRVKERTGVKTIIQTHNIEYQRFRSMGKWWWPVLKVYEKRSFKKADAIFFITPEDKAFAIKQWGINKEKCIDVPFGIDIMKYPEDKTEAKSMLTSKHSIAKEDKILLFNGVLGYKPNLDALKIILDKVNPLLLAQTSFKYKIIICGKGLPEELKSLSEYADKNVIFAGFVLDIETYFKGSDIFLNPVQSGGGIKTKMVEAIGYGTTVVATATGATGMDVSVCGNKLVVVEDNDWGEFSKAIVTHADETTVTPEEYYNRYYWGNMLKNMTHLSE